MADVKAQMAIADSTVAIHPEVFNRFNALGFAYLAKGKTSPSFDAFSEAMEVCPNAKGGDFDLARVSLEKSARDRCDPYPRTAVTVDLPSRKPPRSTFPPPSPPYPFLEH
ncbi:MAG: hypothetical protein HQL73_01165 [Magnetococcales bacterium]|nr:hypothetical protein [Magnetococcales bacterium]